MRVPVGVFQPLHIMHIAIPNNKHAYVIICILGGLLCECDDASTFTSRGSVPGAKQQRSKVCVHSKPHSFCRQRFVKEGNLFVKTSFSINCNSSPSIISTSLGYEYIALKLIRFSLFCLIQEGLIYTYEMRLDWHEPYASCKLRTVTHQPLDVDV